MVNFKNKTFFSAIIFIVMCGVPVVHVKGDPVVDGIVIDAAKRKELSIHQYRIELKKKLRTKHHALLDKLFQSAQKYFEYSRNHEIVFELYGTYERFNRISATTENMKEMMLWVHWLSGFIPGKRWSDIWGDIAPGLYHQKKCDLRDGIPHKDTMMIEKENLALKKTVSDLISELKKTVTQHQNTFKHTREYLEHSMPAQNLWNDYVKDFGNLLYAIAEDYYISEQGENCGPDTAEIANNRAVLVQQWTSFLLTKRIKILKEFQEEMKMYLDPMN